MAMGMLLQGTSGGTEKEIGSTIFHGLNKDDVAKKFKQLREVRWKKTGVNFKKQFRLKFTDES
jgi:hypothetical protein